MNSAIPWQKSPEMRELSLHRDALTAQQYRTLRGQIRAGDTEGAARGLKKLLKEAMR